MFHYFIGKFGFFIGGFLGLTAYSVIGTLLIYIICLIRAFTEEDRARKRGARYEDSIADVLRQYFKVPIYRNLILTKSNGETTEIDMAFVTKQGIFAIECKHRRYQSGYIIDYDDDYWGENFYNPIKQNKGHVAHLRSIFPDIPIYNIVYLSFSFRLHINNSVINSLYDPFVNLFDRKIGIISSWTSKKGTKLFQKTVESMPYAIDSLKLHETQKALEMLQGTAEQQKQHQMQERLRNL